jgi:hypothetical protein
MAVMCKRLTYAMVTAILGVAFATMQAGTPHDCRMPGDASVERPGELHSTSTDLKIASDEILSLASKPVPASEATDVTRDIVLSWTPADGARQSDVYFGISADAVAAADRENEKGPLVSRAQDANTYDPGGKVAYGRTYYWRVDGIDASGSVIAPGAVWSFTVEPAVRVVTSTDIAATASSSDKGRGPELTINGSGMTGNLADSDARGMWTTVTGGASNAWIRYTFDQLYKMQEVRVWNYNSEAESIVGYGLKDVTILYSIDADPNRTTWTTLGDFVFEQAPGEDNSGPNATIALNGLFVRQMKIVVKSVWNPSPTTGKCGLSEVRFFYVPVVASSPKPASGSANIDPAVTLSWRAGHEAVTHRVYFGTDSNGVRDNQMPPVALNRPTYTPSDIELGSTYYWKVDEVNMAAAPAIWTGPVWSFATPPYFTVDDFESYDDMQGTAIFNIWSDGYNTSTNGSQVGKDDPPFSEMGIVHSGRQSMPFFYGRKGLSLSEATRTFATPQNWARGGIRTLVIWFRGTTENTPARLYVKINGNTVDYPGDASVLTGILWKQWSIDLSPLSDLDAVTTLTLGLAGEGQGTLYFDDFRLYAASPAVASPLNPGTANLMACFAMEDGVRDTSGHDYTGSIYNVVFVDSMTGSGRAARFNGVTSCVDMGTTFSSSLLRNLTSCTFAVWVNYAAAANQWGRVFDFGLANSSAYAFMTHRGNDSIPEFRIRTTTLTERAVVGPWAPSAGWHHLAVVIDASGLSPVMAFYVDGEVGESNRPGVVPKDMGVTTSNWLGRSQRSTDPYLNAAIDEFRIYNRALTAAEIRYLAGDR